MISALVSLIILAVVLFIVFRLAELFLAPLMGPRVMQLIGLLLGLLFFIAVLKLFVPFLGVTLLGGNLLR